MTLALVKEAPSTLDECEAVIERGMKAFVEVGQALLAIRDARLYRETHGTFEAYCQDRWGFNRIRAHQLIEASGVVQNFEHADSKPTNDAQARELAGLPADQAKAVWDRTVENTDGKPTAAAVKQTRAELGDWERETEAGMRKEEACNADGSDCPPDNSFEHLIKVLRKWIKPSIVVPGPRHEQERLIKFLRQSADKLEKELNK